MYYSVILFPLVSYQSFKESFVENSSKSIFKKEFKINLKKNTLHYKSKSISKIF